MPQFEKGNSFGKGRAKGSGYVQRCTKYADKKGWKQLERIAEGKRPLDPKEEKAAIKEEGGLIFLKGDTKKERSISPIQNDIPSAKLSQAARKLIIEYGHGKPRVAVDLDPDGTGETSLFKIIAQAAAENLKSGSGASDRDSKPHPKRS